MGDVVRIAANGPVDPLEHGPPKRVGHMVENVGGNIASSKKRASWKFTFGESDKVHEVVLLHSVMSAKKVVEYDGREKYHVAAISPGDWSIILMLEHRNSAIEVRINEFESPDMPRYDMLIDRVPYRKMDVFRRNNKKTANTSNGNTYQPATKGGHKQQGGYHHWGPGDPASDIDDDNAPVVPLDKAIPTKKTAPPPEINLIDTSIPDVVSVPAPSVVFDPLGPTPLGFPTQVASPVTLNGILYDQPPLQAQPQQRTFAPPPPAFDPFASLDQPKQPGGHVPLQPQTAYRGYPAQPPQQFHGHYGSPQAPPYPAYNNFQQQQQPQQFYNHGVHQQHMNISAMVNSIQGQHGIQAKKPAGHDININPFAGMR